MAKTDFTNPKDMNEDEIEERYRALWTYVVGNNKRDAEASLLSTEMNRMLVEATTKNSHLWTKISLGVSFLALTFASVSACFSYIDWKEDSQWQQNQINLLGEINHGLKDISSSQSEKSLIKPLDGQQN